MPTQAQRAARARRRAAARQRKRRGVAQQVLAVMPPARRQRQRTRRPRGLFSNIGNTLLPGIGGALGQFADNAANGLISNFFGGKKAGIAKSGRITTNQSQFSYECGSEYLTTITVPADTQPGTLLLQRLIAGPEFGTRLKQFARLWAKTRFLGVRIVATPQAPTTVAGGYILAIDPDPSQVYPSGVELEGRLMALKASAKTNAWDPLPVTMVPNPLDLFNVFNPDTASDAELRQYACGQVLMGTTGVFSEAVSITLQIEWAVMFSRPDTSLLNSIIPDDTRYLTVLKNPTDVTFSATGVSAFRSTTLSIGSDATFNENYPATAGTVLTLIYPIKVTMKSGVPGFVDKVEVTISDASGNASQVRLTGFIVGQSTGTTDTISFTDGNILILPPPTTKLASGFNPDVSPVLIRMRPDIMRDHQRHLDWQERLKEQNTINRLKTQAMEQALLSKMISAMSTMDLEGLSDAVSHRKTADNPTLALATDVSKTYKWQPSLVRGYQDHLDGEVVLPKD